MQDLIEFRYESLKTSSNLIILLYKLIIGRFKNNRENYLRKCFWKQEKETRVKFNPGLSANRPSNNWGQRSSEGESRATRVAWIIIKKTKRKQKSWLSRLFCRLHDSRLLPLAWKRTRNDLTVGLISEARLNGNFM